MQRVGKWSAWLCGVAVTACVPTVDATRAPQDTGREAAASEPAATPWLHYVVAHEHARARLRARH